MKIIDLYVMLSKGEQPKKFKYKDEWYAYSVSDYDFRTLKREYRDADIPTYQYLMEIIDASNLNDEVELIEEEQEISKITKEEFEKLDKRTLLQLIVKNQNKLIDIVKELKV